MAQPLRYLPRKKSRSNTPRSRLLDAAASLFCRHGINSVGVDAIIEEAGTAKATLYNLFGSKEALACEVLDQEGLRWRDWIFNGLDNFEGDAKLRLLHVFDLLHAWFSNRDYYGCPFINTVAEHDKFDNKMRDIALGHKKIVLARISTLVSETGVTSPEAMAHEMGIIIDGAIVAALITRDPRVALIAKNVATVLMDARTSGLTPPVPEKMKMKPVFT